MSKRVGVVAGQGELPIDVALDAKSRGYEVIVVGLKPLADMEGLIPVSDEFYPVNVGKLNSIIGTLKSAGVTEAVLAGKVPKTLLFKGGVKPDVRAVRLLMSLGDRKDDTILLAVTREFEKDGIKLLKTTDFASDLLMPEGVLTDEKPTRAEWRDIRFGYKTAKEMGRLDIGQTVVVKDRAVMSVEAIEGTDEAIKRGAKLAGKGAVVVKVAKPGQDLRFDVPVAGEKTLQVMAAAGVSVFALEAGKAIILNRPHLTREASRLGIKIVGILDKRFH